MRPGFRPKLFRSFLAFTLGLALPLLIVLVLLGITLPTIFIGTLSQTTAAQIAETLSTNISLGLLRLNPEFTLEGHRSSTQPMFSPIAERTREALLKRSGKSLLNKLLERRIANQVLLVMPSANSNTGAWVVAAANSTAFGQTFNYSAYADNSISPSLNTTAMETADSNGDGYWSAFAPVFAQDGKPAAMVVVHSDAGLIQTVIWSVVVLALLIVSAAVGFSARVAWRWSERIHQPLATLHQGMLATADGDFDSELAPPQSQDEFEELIRHFNQMRAQLKERLKLQESMQLAAEIQGRLLPKQLPQVPGFDLASHLEYAEYAGGDFIDSIVLGHNHEGQRQVLLVVADVSGHGISAALLVAWLRAALRVLLRQGKLELPELLLQLNAALVDDADTGKFITLVLLRLTEGSRRIEVLNAGHDPLRLYSQGQTQAQSLIAHGPPLGVSSDIAWPDAQTLELNPNQRLLVLTDGVQDCQDPDKQRLGLDAVDAQMQQCWSQDLTATIAALVRQVHDHRGQQPLADDVTLLLLAADQDFASGKKMP